MIYFLHFDSHYFTHINSPGAGAHNPLGEILMSKLPSIIVDHCCKFHFFPLNFDFLHFVSHYFIHEYSLRAGAHNLWGQNFNVNRYPMSSINHHKNTNSFSAK